MRFPLIKVRHKGSKEEGFYVGYAPYHHKLIVDKDGNIKYVNIQNMETTSKNGMYEFLTKKSYYGQEIELVPFKKILEIYIDWLCMGNNEIRQKNIKLIKILERILLQLEKQTEKQREEYVLEMIRKLLDNDVDEEIKSAIKDKKMLMLKSKNGIFRVIR